MAQQWLSEIAQRAPQIALAFLAAKRGGPEAVAAFQAGMQRAQLQRDQLGRQAQQDTQAQAIQQQEMALRQRQQDRLDAGDKRDVENETYRRKLDNVTYLSNLARTLQESATDPLAGEQDFARQAAIREQMSGAEPGSLTAMTPSLSTGVSRRKAEAARRAAIDIVNRLDNDRKNANDLGYEIDDTTASAQWESLPEALQEFALAQGHKAGEPIKYSQARQLAGLSSFTANKKPITAKNFDEAIFLADQRGDEREVARLREEKRKNEATERAPVQSAAADNARSWVTRNGQPVRVRESEIQPGDAPYNAGSGLGGGQQATRDARVASALNDWEKLRKAAPVRSPGPMGMLEGAGRTVAGAVGLDPQAATFRRMLPVTGMKMAVALQGAANLSDRETQIWSQRLGSMASMDYETQMTLLNSAGEDLAAGANVTQVNGVWVPAGRSIQLAPGAAESVGGSAPKVGQKRTYPNGNTATWDGVGWAQD